MHGEVLIIEDMPNYLQECNDQSLNLTLLVMREAFGKLSTNMPYTLVWFSLLLSLRIYRAPTLVFLRGASNRTPLLT